MKHIGTEGFRAAVSLEFSSQTFAPTCTRRFSLEMHFSTTGKTAVTFGRDDECLAWPEGLESISIKLSFVDDPTEKVEAIWTPADGQVLTLDQKATDRQVRDILEWAFVYEGDLEEGCPFHLDIEPTVAKTWRPQV